MKERDLESDLNKLAAAFFKHLEFQDDYDTGAPGLDQKRPFGNSGVFLDVLEIIGAEPEGDEDGEKCYSQKQYAYARNLYVCELTGWLRTKCAPIFQP